MVGRRFSDFDGNYGSVQMDELHMFNSTLTAEDISQLMEAKGKEVK